MIRFLFATLVYRLANGLLFLSVAWHLVKSADDGAMSLAIASITGFLPAVIIAPFAKRMVARVDSRRLTIAGIASLFLLSLMFVPFLKLPSVVLAINFFLLLVFFLLEGAWDTLLATIAIQLPQVQADTLNAHQSSATQAGLMLGGLPLGILTRFGGSELSFFVVALLYLIAIALLAFVTASPQRSHDCLDHAKIVRTTDVVSTVKYAQVPWHALLTLALIWPCLTLVNMALPLLANSLGGGTVEHAALLDAMIGLGMAFAGLIYSPFDRLLVQRQQFVVMACTVSIPLPFILLLVTGYALWPLAASFFLCGIGFGLFRVGLRKHLIATQPTHRVGQIVYSCNAYGFPILVVAAFFYAQSWLQGPVVPLLVFIVFAVAGSGMMLNQRRMQCN